MAYSKGKHKKAYKSIEDLENEFTHLRYEIIDRKALKFACSLKLGKGGKSIIKDLLYNNIGKRCGWCDSSLSILNIVIDYNKSFTRNSDPAKNYQLVIKNPKSLMVLCEDCNSLRSNIQKSLFHKLITSFNTELKIKLLIISSIRYYNYFYDNFSYKLYTQIISKYSNNNNHLKTYKQPYNKIIHKKALNLNRVLGWGNGGTAKAERMLIKSIGTPCKWCGCKLTIYNISIDHKNPLNRVIGDPNDYPSHLNECSNLRAICLTCNKLKGNIPEYKFEKLIDFINTDYRLKYIIISALTVYNSRYGTEVYKIYRELNQ
jgi:5-methylcytosine-specific restriction endonuclease McrA